MGGWTPRLSSLEKELHHIKIISNTASVAVFQAWMASELRVMLVIVKHCITIFLRPGLVVANRVRHGSTHT